MNGIKQFRKNKQGFLLVDAMIGVLVVAIGLAALSTRSMLAAVMEAWEIIIRVRANCIWSG